MLRAPQHEYTRRLIAAIPGGGTRAGAARRRRQPRVLQVQDLCKTYRSGGGLLRRGREVQAARDISFELWRGQTLGPVGESGSGKSTVGRCIAGLAPSTAGAWWSTAAPWRPAAALPRHAAGQIQMVFRDPYASLNPRHRIGAAIAAGPIAQGVPREQARARAVELLARSASAPRPPNAIRTNSPAGSASASASRARWPCARRC